MSSVLVWGWDDGGPLWRKIAVDAAGHLQVDTLSSALPAGAATLAKQSDQLTKLNSIITKLAGGLPAALDTLALKVREQNWPADYPLPAAQVTSLQQVTEQGTPSVHLYGYDGSNWQTLLVESSTYKNLRVAIYDADTKIESNAIGLSNNYLPDFRGLMTYSIGVTLRTADRLDALHSPYFLGDNTEGKWMNAAPLYGYNGATWDRLRSYGTGILKVGRAEVGLLTVRKTATGQVGATGARKLYWIHENPSAGSGVWEISDATTSGQTIVLDHFSTTREGHMVTFDPPMEFSNGIYLETYTNMTSLVFGYL